MAYPGHLQSLADVIVWKSVPWRLQALCRYLHHPSWWFHEGQKKQDLNIQEKAKRVCRQCPVRWQCLAKYMAEPAGIYGGFDYEERQALIPTIPIRLRSQPRVLKEILEGGQATGNNCGSTVTIRQATG